MHDMCMIIGLRSRGGYPGDRVSSQMGREILVQPEDVIRRLEAADVTADLVQGRDVDLTDARLVDSLAERLVEKFYRATSKEVLSLLVHTTTPILDAASLKVRRDHGLALPSTDIVDAFFSEMCLDVGAPPVPARGFLGAAMTRIDSFAAEVADALHAGHPVSSAGLLVAQSLGGSKSQPGDDAADQITAEYCETLCRAFHSLDLDDRRILIARVVDELSEAEVAAELELPLTEVDERTERALARLEQRKTEFLDGESEGRS